MKKKCCYCGRKGTTRFVQTGHLWCCSSNLRCFNRLLDSLHIARIALERLIRASSPMSNLCFNLSQQSGRTLTDEICSQMRAAQRGWDADVRLLNETGVRK